MIGKPGRAPGLFPRYREVFHPPDTWAIDGVAKDVPFNPPVMEKESIYRSRLAVLEAYEFARERANEAARLADDRKQLDSGLDKLLKVWRDVGPPLMHAAKEMQQFPITAVWWDFGLWNSDQPKQLSPLIMASRDFNKIDELSRIMDDLSSLRKTLPRAWGRPRAARDYAFVYSLAKWWKEVTGTLPPHTRAMPGRVAKSPIFFTFVKRAKTDAEIPTPSLESAIKNVVWAMKAQRGSNRKKDVRKTKKQKTSAK